MAGGVTRPTEEPPKFQDKYLAIMAQMTAHHKWGKKYSEDDIDVMIRKSLVTHATEKLNNLTDDAARRIKKKRLEEIGMTREEYRQMQYEKFKKQIEAQGYVFKLTKDQQAKIDAITDRSKQEAAKELTETTAEALKKILTTI